MSAMMLSSQNLQSHVPPSPRDVPLNAHLENLRHLACSLLSEVQSLTELRPKTSHPVDLKDAVQQFERELISAALTSGPPAGRKAHHLECQGKAVSDPVNLCGERGSNPD